MINFALTQKKLLMKFRKKRNSMIKHSFKDKQVHISIDNRDFSYRIPLNKIGNTISWKIGGKGSEGIVIKNVSTWTLKLFTKNTTENKYLEQFKVIIQEYSAKKNIDWKATLLAVNIQNEYNNLVKTNTADETKISEEEIISTLEEKYNLD